MIRIGYDIQRIQDVENTRHIWMPDVMFTAAELQYAAASKHPPSTLAGLYCAREALYKALGTRVDCLWTDAEIVRGPNNRPQLRPRGALATYFDAAMSTADVSISHSAEYAAAVVIVAPVPLASKPDHEAPLNQTSGTTLAISETIEADTVNVSTTLTVRPNDLDRLGHVNNAVVLEYFETGRQAWLRTNQLKVSTVLPVVARADVRYRKEIPETVVTVVTKLASAGVYSVEFAQSVLVEEELAAEARIQVGFVNQATRSLASVEDFFEARS